MQRNIRNLIVFLSLFWPQLISRAEQTLAAAVDTSGGASANDDDGGVFSVQERIH
jgi:hypothetical protein